MLQLQYKLVPFTIEHALQKPESRQPQQQQQRLLQANQRLYFLIPKVDESHLLSSSRACKLTSGVDTEQTLHVSYLPVFSGHR